MVLFSGSTPPWAIAFTVKKIKMLERKACKILDFIINFYFYFKNTKTVAKGSVEGGEDW